MWALGWARRDSSASDSSAFSLHLAPAPQIGGPRGEKGQKGEPAIIEPVRDPLSSWGLMGVTPGTCTAAARHLQEESQWGGGHGALTVFVTSSFLPDDKEAQSFPGGPRDSPATVRDSLDLWIVVPHHPALGCS